MAPPAISGIAVAEQASSPPPAGLPASAPGGVSRVLRLLREPMVRAIAVGLCLLGVFLLGFLAYAYGLSNLQENRAQATMYATLRGELGAQVAPLVGANPSAPRPGTYVAQPGDPVAILNIPAIGIANMVVVEGTSPESLELGPGHRRDTPLPGEYGVSEIIGRRATFGAPFGRLLDLRKGDVVQVTTGQGTSQYIIMAMGDSGHLVVDPAPNRLLLVTSCSAVVPTEYCYWDADLTSAPQQDPGGRPAITQTEGPLSGDTSALLLTMLWGLALVIVSAAGTIAAVRWSPRLTYIATAPLVLAILWNLYQSLAALLPNVY